MKIQEINNHISKKWNDIALFYPNNTGFLVIDETSTKSDILKQVKILQLPDNCWVFENEFYQLPNVTKEHRNSFSSMGDKVEKTIIWQKDHVLYLFMVEMKSLLTLENVSSCIKKFEHSLNYFVTYLAAHPYFQSLSELYLTPIGVVCYNEDADYSNFRNPYELSYGKTKPRFKKKYIDEKKRSFLMEVEPIVLEAKEMPVIFLQTPNDKDSHFSLNFQDIYLKLTTI